ncbi:hypothetical protein SNEBB_007168 [Seison nebaliae]|nr:hypothetical protein SNEBB_007168 [Seison nebaliae]
MLKRRLSILTQYSSRSTTPTNKKILFPPSSQTKSLKKRRWTHFEKKKNNNNNISIKPIAQSSIIVEKRKKSRNSFASKFRMKFHVHKMMGKEENSYDIYENLSRIDYSNDYMPNNNFIDHLTSDNFGYFPRETSFNEDSIIMISTPKKVRTMKNELSISENDSSSYYITSRTCPRTSTPVRG